MDRKYDFIQKFLLGMVLGIASITPGISAGVIAAGSGLYEPAVRALVNFRKEYGQSFRFLFPLGLGVASGVLLFSRVMQKLMISAEIRVLYVFLGLVAGSVPALYKEANLDGFRKRFFGAALVALAFILFTGKLMAWFPQFSGRMELETITVLLCGAVLALGTIIPGISSSLILMFLGVYERLLAAFIQFDLRILAGLAVGFALAALPLLKLVDLLFRKYRGFAYYGVIGILFGSMVLVFPGFRTGATVLVDLLFSVASGVLSWAAMRWQKRV
jgi:putative membrane protein